MRQQPNQGSAMTTYVHSGQTSSGIQVSPGSALQVQSGGTAEAVTVLSGGRAYVRGTISGVVVDSRGMVSGDGLIRGAIISGGVISGTGTIINSIVSAGGLVTETNALLTTVMAGGLLEALHDSHPHITGGVDSSINVSGATITLGGVELVGVGAMDSGNVISANGLEQVTYGGTTISTLVGAGGTLTLGQATASGGNAGGNAVHTIVAAGGTELVGYGAYDLGAGVAGEQIVDGGTVSGVLVSSGAIQQVDSGQVTRTTVLSGGSQILMEGTLVHTIVEQGGFLDSDYFTQATKGLLLSPIIMGNAYVQEVNISGALVTAGGTLTTFLTDNSALDTVVDKGLLAITAYNSVVDGTVISNGGTFTFVDPLADEFPYSNSVLTNTTVLSGGLAVIAQNGYVYDTVVSSGGELQLQGQVHTSATTLLAGGTIEINLGSAVVDPTVKYSDTTKILTIAASGFTESLPMSGSYGHDTFHVAASGDNEIVTLTPTADLASAAGTIFVQHDLVPVAGGTAIPITAAAPALLAVIHPGLGQPHAETILPHHQA